MPAGHEAPILESGVTPEATHDLAGVTRRTVDSGYANLSHAGRRQPPPKNCNIADHILDVINLSKRYAGAQRPAVSNISFVINAGEIVGLLGANGAGKSTTIRMLTTLIPTSSGTVTIGGVDVATDPTAVRAHIGVVGQSNTLDSACTVFENLYFHCRYHGMSRRHARQRASEYIAAFGLEGRGDDKPSVLSGGLARRLELARAMSHAPQLLLLDEPTNELDVPSRALFWQQVHAVQGKGAGVLLATHLLQEAEEHCDRVVIMHAGKVVLEGKPADLRGQFRGGQMVTLRLHRPPDVDVIDELLAASGVVRCHVDDSEVKILLQNTSVPLDALARVARPYTVLDITTRQASLQEIFLDAVGHGYPTDGIK
jgi:ABC-2 type transport system ATP-binding protein